MTDATTLDAALNYVRFGWYVFPVQPADVGKAPLVEGGFKSATQSLPQVAEWWTRWPDAQIGVDCGRSSIMAVDLDVRDDVDGNLQWESLELEHGSARCGIVMKTPHGRQLFFLDPSGACRRRVGVLPGVDLLGDGGYTIVPSPASPARKWVAGDPFDADDWVRVPGWVEQLGERRASGDRSLPLAQGSATKRSASPALPMATTPLTEEQVQDIRSALAYIPNDGRDEWLRVGFALKSTSAGEQAYDLWCEWSRATPEGGIHPKYSEKDQRYTWEHAAELRADGREVTLATLFYMAIDRGYQGPVPDGVEQVEIVVQNAVEDEPAEVLPAAPSTNHQITLMDWDDVAKLSPVEWLVEGLIPMESLGLLAGDTEAGKTFCAIDLALRLVHGLPWCGQAVRPCSVLYLAGEGQSGLAGRFRAWRQYHAHLGLDAEDRYLLVSSEIPLLSKRSMHQVDRLVASVTKAKGHPPGLIVFDTLSQGLEDDENDAKAVAPVLRGLVALSRNYGAAVQVLHHLVKLNTKPGFKVKPTRDSIRGSSALTRNVDVVLGLVVTDEAGGRELQTWKQKDGEKLAPIPLLLMPTDTGLIRSNTLPERSCVLELAPELPVLEKKSNDDGAGGPLVNEPAIKSIEATMASVLETMAKEGALEGSKGMSANEVVDSVGRQRKGVLAALSKASRQGKIINIGTKSKHQWVLANPKSVPQMTLLEQPDQQPTVTTP